MILGAGRYFGNALNFRVMKSARFLVVALVLMMPMLVSNALAQARHKVEQVSGYVLDSVSRKPIPSVLVQCNWLQIRTDKTGHFAFISSPKCQLYTGDYVWVNTMYYNGSTVINSRRSHGNDSLTVLIHRNKYRLGTVCQPSDSVFFRPYASPLLFDWVPGYQLAVLLKNPLMADGRQLRTIRLSDTRLPYGNSNGLIQYLPFRLRIYRADASTGEPADDLLTDNVVLWFPRAGNSYTFDLKGYHIVLPAGNFIVALEALAVGDKYYPCPPILEAYRPTGPVLQAPCAFAESRTWQLDYIPKHWQPIPPTENCWPLYESIVSIEVESAPAKH